MGKKQSSRKITSEKCAARVMETIPLAMRFIRADIRSRNSTTISVPQFRTLAFLDRNPGASVSDLAEHLGVTRATASANTERLVQRDFVHRCDDPKERRRVVLNLTEAGKVHLEECRGQTRERISQLLNSLTEQQIVLIEEGLTLLKEVLEETSLEPLEE
ncbi:MarR family transcriptional regulator [[Phormidium ambiguum] IAM M-71]|uniref:MarR family transcriptional regulator n=1 Tax=[Phormidium ambiguum] IAM M-71 TaxID=454136 RepID=A0A1U7IBF0_9CYAN|nr:MarR family transcriptional regulator [Phormidium ambiguum]OKH33926.1 MarR family transcriptional regulator [Phormidium ambiguum IAM M-71]